MSIISSVNRTAQVSVSTGAPLDDHRFAELQHRFGGRRQCTRHEDPQRVVCGWCGVTMVEGPPSSQVSHGICPACTIVFETGGVR